MTSIQVDQLSKVFKVQRKEPDLRGRDVGALVWLSPLVALIFILIAYRFRLFGLRHYGSTGS